MKSSIRSSKTFCPVCKSAGKNADVFLSHNIRGHKNLIVCPILLSQSCNHCGNNGHTVKYCKFRKNIEEKKKEKEKCDRRQKFKRELSSSASTSSVSARKNRSGRFQELDDESEVEVEVEVEVEKPKTKLNPIIKKWSEYSDSDSE